MRLAELTLERYGRFEGCSLTFRSGTPDLHVIYGPNEAGKSTTMAAVSDLLFGFPMRSSQNYRFDSPLLRVGALLEEDDRRFTCRRRKTKVQSLVDADDRPIDEAPLLAMLRGQDRERFRLGFSLDQTRLREGGEAMVGAKDDLGQALFAAGSGLTGVPEALAALEKEADDIWGRRAAGRRVYTAAERRHEDAQRALRELQLKPKTWNDADAALKQRVESLAALERTRADLAGERRHVERLRRVGPDIRRRGELLAAAADAPAVIPTLHALAAADAVLADLASAERARFATAKLSAELDQEVASLALDDAGLAAAAEIEALIERWGAERKAALDLARLQVELREARGREARLQAELGGAPAMASRLAVGRLRELAGSHGQLEAKLSELRASAADAELRAGPLRLALIDTPLLDSLPDLTAAVDAAQRLGDDLDARCGERGRDVARLEAEALAALARTAPWSGKIEVLAVLPDVGAEEIDAAVAAAIAGRRRLEDETAAVRRAGDHLAQLELERRSLAEHGGAIPAARIAEARRARDARWEGVKAQLLGRAPLPDPAADAAAFEAALSQADAIADQRFAVAETSGRLAALDARRAAAELELAQAQARAAAVEAALAADAAAWAARLAAAGLPELEPTRLRTWRESRDAALRAQGDLLQAREALGADISRRAEARARLVALIPPDTAFPGEALGPPLERAVRLKAEGEEQVRRFLESKAALRGLEDQIAELSRRAGRTEIQLADLLEHWSREAAGAGLELPIAGAPVRLALHDELRAAAEAADALQLRVAGIGRDAQAFAADLASLVARLGQPPQSDPAEALDTLRARLAAARSAADALARLETSRRARADDFRRAEAAAGAARVALGPVMAELGVAETGDLPAALESAKRERDRREELTAVERRIAQGGDSRPLVELAAACEAEDADALAARAERLDRELAALDPRVTEAADATGVARRSFEALEHGPGAAQAAADAALARAEMDVQAEAYMLKRSQALVLRWVQERYRERNQNPLLVRASALFRTLTLGRYRELRADPDAPMRLMGVFADGARAVGVEDMSEGATDQLFLALRLAAVEQAIAAGARMPFLADDLFVNFDDDRAAAGLRALADLARSTQVLIFTHHPHLLALARSTVGADAISECPLPA